MIIRSAANLPERVQLVEMGAMRTKQSMKDESDINMIMKKFIKTGVIDHSAKFGAEYGYATGLDFTTSMNIIAKGSSMFAELPAEVRARFNGDPAYFLDFVQDPANGDEMRKLGLREPEAPGAGLPASEAPEPPEGPPEASEASVASAEASD